MSAVTFDSNAETGSQERLSDLITQFAALTSEQRSQDILRANEYLNSPEGRRAFAAVGRDVSPDILAAPEGS